MAREDRTGTVGAKRSFSLKPEVARDLGELIGVDFTTASTKTLHEAIKNLSNSGTIQVGHPGRYSQVRSSPIY
jgi:hypothetical protein